jgi:hypothetical protein
LKDQLSALPPVDISPFISIFKHKYAGCRIVSMPPGWREKEESDFTFVLFHEELSEQELREFFALATAQGLINPRPVSRNLLELSSLFHPLFFERFRQEAKSNPDDEAYTTFIQSLKSYQLQLPSHPGSRIGTNRYYLQSLLFLAGCTLSAAIIQNRFTEATIQSKLDRLWQVSFYLESLEIDIITREALQQFVLHYGNATDLSSFDRICAIKKMYGRLLNALSDGVATTPLLVKESPLTAAQQERFGFVSSLRSILSGNLLAIFVYGSSVTSESFADYDVILYVKNSHTALLNLSGKNPSYNGVDINISVYDEEDFYGFQSLSGDNLDQHVLCLYGQAVIPVKPPNELLYRNFSFGYVRMRQLLGMAGFLAKEGTHFGLEGKANLYQYFIKIPMHIVKGMRAAMRAPNNKELINQWTKTTLDYAIEEQVALCENGQPWEAISNAYAATLKLLYVLNDTYHAFVYVECEVPEFLR